jgi:FKBP-type peptidyl-prolyl cis-trans isomerase 2
MIESGKTAKVHYKGTLADGTVFDSSEGQPPLAFEVGADNMIPGFEAAVIDMELEETKTVTIPCAEAYGETRDDMIGEIPRDNLPAEIEPEVKGDLKLVDCEDADVAEITVSKPLLNRYQRTLAAFLDGARERAAARARRGARRALE